MKKYRKILGFTGLIAGIVMLLLFFAPFYKVDSYYEASITGFDYGFDFDEGTEIAKSLSLIFVMISIVLSAVQMKFYKLDWITGIFFIAAALSAILCTVGTSSYVSLGVGAVFVFIIGFAIGFCDIFSIFKSFFAHLND